MGRRNPYKKCPWGQKTSPARGWRVVNILNKPAMSSYIVSNLQPPIFGGSFFYLSGNADWGTMFVFLLYCY